MIWNTLPLEIFEIILTYFDLGSTKTLRLAYWTADGMLWMRRRRHLTDIDSFGPFGG